LSVAVEVYHIAGHGFGHPKVRMQAFIKILLKYIILPDMALDLVPEPTPKVGSI
jgi:hypothetical protein